MSRKYLAAAKCSQMSSPKSGEGSGGDRCTAAVVTMINCSLKLGPSAKAGVDAETIMYSIVDWLNPGKTTLPLENLGIWFPRWLQTFGYDKLVSLNNIHNPSWSDVVAVADRGHLAVVGVNDYRQLRQYDNGNPYAWNAFNDPPAGHVAMMVGYDTGFRTYGQTIILHDPLRGTSGQPWDYSFSSVQKAGFSDLTEIVPAASLAPLPWAVNTDLQAAPPPDIATQLADALAQIKAYQAWLLAAPKS